MAAGGEAARFLVEGTVSGGVVDFGGLIKDSLLPAKATLFLEGGCHRGGNRRHIPFLGCRGSSRQVDGGRMPGKG